MIIQVFVVILIKLHFFYNLGDCGNPDAKRLYDDLLSNYNRLIRPVSNNTDKLTVYLGLKLSQLIDVVSIFMINIYIIIYSDIFNIFIT